MTDFPAGPLLGSSTTPLRTAVDVHSPVFLKRIALAVTLIVGCAAMTFSFDGQREIAAWTMVSASLTFLVPIVIDGSIIAFNLVAIHLRSERKSTVLVWVTAYSFTFISTVLNVIHVLETSPFATDDIKTITGAAIAGLMPVSVNLVTHFSIVILVRRQDRQARESQPVVVSQGVTSAPGLNLDTSK